MTIPQVQGSPAMELVEGRIKRSSVSDLNAVGGKTSRTFFNLFCSPMFQNQMHAFVARS